MPAGGRLLRERGSDEGKWGRLFLSMRGGKVLPPIRHLPLKNSDFEQIGQALLSDSRDDDKLADNKNESCDSRQTQ